MIKLNVSEYCQSCMEFDPRVIQRPERLNIGDDICFYGDTIIECKYRCRCEVISNYLKYDIKIRKEENNESV